MLTLIILLAVLVLLGILDAFIELSGDILEKEDTYADNRSI